MNKTEILAKQIRERITAGATDQDIEMMIKGHVHDFATTFKNIRETSMNYDDQLDRLCLLMSDYDIYHITPITTML